MQADRRRELRLAREESEKAQSQEATKASLKEIVETVHGEKKNEAEG